MTFGYNFNVAPTSKRYIGLYNYCSYWGHWDKVIDANDGWWTVQEVDLQGNPVGEIRKHCTAMNAGQFAEKPFNVYEYRQKNRLKV